ncbi:MAG: hypothetical protein NC182_01555 [Prevotella sp.]|nr:hypothetical protein [Staphylococcus sp.]MCM1349868.1 hypothetical protein [Prevotella sp.]
MNKNDKTLYFIIGLVILAVLFVNILLSLITLDFSFDTLKNPSFWSNIATTQVLTLTPYFAFIAVGRNATSKLDEVIALEDDVKTDFRTVDNTFLTNDLYDMIKIENLIYRCDAYIEKLNIQISKAKEENKRNELIKEKDKCIEWLKYYKYLNIPEKNNVVEMPNNDFDITTKNVKCLKIDERSFSIGQKTFTDEIGSFEPNKVIARDSTSKIAFSVLFSCLFASIGLGVLKGGWQGVYDTVWRTLLIAVNCYTGYNEGEKIIMRYKVGAFKEKKNILNKFFNKMFILGKIKSE